MSKASIADQTYSSSGSRDLQRPATHPAVPFSGWTNYGYWTHDGRLVTTTGYELRPISERPSYIGPTSAKASLPEGANFKRWLKEQVALVTLKC